MEKYYLLKASIEQLEIDLIKFFEKNNKTAGVRARKSLQSIKEISQSLRLEILEKKIKEKMDKPLSEQNQEEYFYDKFKKYH